MYKNICSQELSPKDLGGFDLQVALDLTEDDINHLHKIVETESRYLSFFMDVIFVLL